MTKSTKQINLLRNWLQFILPSSEGIGKKWHISFNHSTGNVRMRNTYKYGRESIVFTGIIHWVDAEYWKFEFNNLTSKQRSLVKKLDLKYYLAQEMLDCLYEYTAGMDTLDEACVLPEDY